MQVTVCVLVLSLPVTITAMTLRRELVAVELSLQSAGCLTDLCPAGDLMLRQCELLTLEVDRTVRTARIAHGNMLLYIQVSN